MSLRDRTARRGASALPPGCCQCWEKGCFLEGELQKRHWGPWGLALAQVISKAGGAASRCHSRETSVRSRQLVVRVPVAMRQGGPVGRRRSPLGPQVVKGPRRRWARAPGHTPVTLPLSELAQAEPALPLCPGGNTGRVRPGVSLSSSRNC